MGDPRQFLPTSFVAPMTDGSDENADEGSRVTCIESMPGLPKAGGLRMRTRIGYYDQANIQDGAD